MKKERKKEETEGERERRQSSTSSDHSERPPAASPFLPFRRKRLFLSLFPSPKSRGSVSGLPSLSPWVSWGGCRLTNLRLRADTGVSKYLLRMQREMLSRHRGHTKVPNLHGNRAVRSTGTDVRFLFLPVCTVKTTTRGKLTRSVPTGRRKTKRPA